MEKTIKSFLKKNWIDIGMTLFYCVFALIIAYDSTLVGFEKLVVIILMVMLIENKLKQIGD